LAWLVTRYDHVRQLFADDNLGRSHPDPQHAPRYSGDVLAGPVGDHATYKHDHARIRRVLTRSFTARRMQALLPRLDAIVSELLDDLTATPPPADFRERFALQLPIRVITDLLGLPAEDRHQLREWSDEAQNTVDSGRAWTALINLNGYMIELVKRKQAQPGDDVLSEMVAARDEHGKLTDEELIRLGHTLVFSGYTSSVARIEFGTVLLLAHPEQREALRRDPALAPRAVEEILRFAMPSVGAIPRYASADIQLDGKLIRAGDLVLLGHEVAGHAPEVFPEPERFDIFREENPHMAFGYGSYFCVGAALARLELQAVFRTLFHRLPGLALAVPAAELRLRDHSLIGGFHELPVTW